LPFVWAAIVSMKRSRMRSCTAWLVEIHQSRLVAPPVSRASEYFRWFRIDALMSSADAPMLNLNSRAMSPDVFLVVFFWAMFFCCYYTSIRLLASLEKPTPCVNRLFMPFR
jgi:hypothetical protein